MARLILDTSVLVTGERKGARPEDLVDANDDAAIAAISVAEMLVGVELSKGKQSRVRRSWIEACMETLPIEDYTVEAARVHASLLAESRRSGRPRGAHDLIVAATAVATHRTVVTLDRTGFEALPGVDLRD